VPRYPRPEDAKTRIGRLRIERGISQERLAHVTGLSVSTLRRLERDQDNPPLRYLVNIAIALDVPLDALIEDEWREWAALASWAPTPPARDWQLPSPSR
jgi:transcriptional regulator with XRE-family HTH domain